MKIKTIETMFKHKLHAIREADKLINKLQTTINKNPKKFCENYGQKEVRTFRDKLYNSDNIHYVEKCDVMNKFDVVETMAPNKHLLK